MSYSTFPTLTSLWNIIATKCNDDGDILAFVSIKNTLTLQKPNLNRFSTPPVTNPPPLLHPKSKLRRLHIIPERCKTSVKGVFAADDDTERRTNAQTHVTLGMDERKLYFKIEYPWRRWCQRGAYEYHSCLLGWSGKYQVRIIQSSEFLDIDRLH